MGTGYLKIFIVGIVLGMCSCLLGATTESLSTILSTVEDSLLQQRIINFYEGAELSSMNSKIPKYDIKAKKLSDRPVRFKSNQETGNPLVDLAGTKLSPSVLKARARRFKKTNEPNLMDATWSSSEYGDKAIDLVESYLDSQEFSESLDNLPTRGEAEGNFWSGDYWNMNWGLTSYRYSSGKKYKLYKNAISAYTQPSSWLKQWENFSSTEISQEVEFWSPSEKYDLLMGDEKFTLTNEQKSEGENFVNEKGSVDEWFGICDGWSPASIFVPAPKQAITTSGAQGVSITWYPDDIRALASLAWTNGDYPHNFVGRRCDITNPKVYKNGRISESECADTNPATFHLALGLLIGKKKIPFIMDATFDAEVWNQPVIAYEFKYFNPLNPKVRSSDWRKVMVSYDETFKQKDRFQKPLTRGYRKANSYHDGGVKGIVGVQTTIVYLAEYEAEFNKESQENVMERVTYTYDLELHQKKGQWVALGGEWHSNLHPDFLWLPQKNSVATEKWDQGIPEMQLDESTSLAITAVAKKASKEGYPLCSAIEALVRASSGLDSYHCNKP